ncbi:hypothetical protein TWF106_010079 [Orbilia oligospora]|uniref:BTB domain-containing protein n=1 Tax=Orbilia oligospora TaxID=2813651 RepID=A0A7C8UDW0_ORBOL|nr:hypothetical protein TWF106_010079 [Orbilia oligospora]
MTAVGNCFNKFNICISDEEANIAKPYNDRLKTHPNDKSEFITILIGEKDATGVYKKKYLLRKNTCIANSEYFRSAFRSTSDGLSRSTWRESRSLVFHFPKLPHFNIIQRAILTGRVTVDPTNFVELYETADYLLMGDVMYLICSLISRQSFIRSIHDLNRCLTRLVEWMEAWPQRPLVQLGFFRAIFFIELTAAVKRSRAARGCRLLGGWEDAPRQWGLNPLKTRRHIEEARADTEIPPGAIPERYNRLKKLRDYVRTHLRDSESWFIEDIRCVECGGGGFR